MDLQSFDWSLLKVFVAVADTGSINAAALQLGHSQAKVSRDMPALARALRGFGGDTLVVWGTADVYLPTPLARRQLDVFPNARVEYLPGVGHWAWLEQPERVADLVVPFLARQVAASVHP